MSLSKFNTAAVAAERLGRISGRIMGRVITDPAGALLAFAKLADDAPQYYFELASKAIKAKLTVGERHSTIPHQRDAAELAMERQALKKGGVTAAFRKAYSAGKKSGVEVATREKLDREKARQAKNALTLKP